MWRISSVLMGSALVVIIQLTAAAPGQGLHRRRRGFSGFNFNSGFSSGHNFPSIPNIQGDRFLPNLQNILNKPNIPKISIPKINIPNNFPNLPNLPDVVDVSGASCGDRCASGQWCVQGKCLSVSDGNLCSVLSPCKANQTCTNTKLSYTCTDNAEVGSGGGNGATGNNNTTGNNGSTASPLGATTDRSSAAAWKHCGLLNVFLALILSAVLHPSSSSDIQMFGFVG